MRIERCPWQCVLIFEEGEKYAGRELVLDGDSHPNGFLFWSDTMRWSPIDSADPAKPRPVTDEERAELVGYIIRKAEETGEEFHEYVDPGDVK